MKIGLDTTPVTFRGTYSQNLAAVLSRYAPEHEYIVDGKERRRVDLYHGFRSSLPLTVRLGRVPAVITVPNLHFLHYPGLYTLPERLVALRLYCRALQRARRVITVNSPAREELSRRLGIDPSKIEVVMPLAAPVPQARPAQTALEAVRCKYALPERFVLMLGTVEPRHNHEVVLDALLSVESAAGVVICGRRTVYSDFLLAYARRRHMAARVEFIYELTPADLPALFRLARAFAYLPDADAGASIVPVVEALRAELPMVLSDTPIHREAAGNAAAYVHPELVGEVAAALENALDDETYRRAMRDRERRRAELFSEYAVAQRLMDIYTSL